MYAKASMMSHSLDKPSKESTKLKKQHSLILNNHDTSSSKNEKDSKEAESAGGTGEDKFKQFEGEGVVFKTKLVGSELVMEPRGDKMCQNSIQRLKAIIKGQKAHKKRIVMKISYEGVKIYDEKTNELLYHHEVPQISFISSDDTDSRTFGYVCDVPNKAHQFICFKTSGPAIQVMSVISSLFEAVLERKKKKEAGPDVDRSATNKENNDNNNSSTSSNKNSCIITQQRQQSDSMLDDQLIIHETSPSEEVEQDSGVISLRQQQLFKQQPQQQSATEELTKHLGEALSLSFSSSSPLDLFESTAGDSGIMDHYSPSAPLANDWALPPPPPPLQKRAEPIQIQPHQLQQRIHQQQPPPAPFPLSIPDRPSFLSLNSSSPVTTSTAQLASAAININLAGSASHNRAALGHHNRSLIYNHSSVSLNDAALTNRSAFVSPVTGSESFKDSAQLANRAAAAGAFVSPMGSVPKQHQHQAVESTDRYAVFNQIDNLPSIFESTSSLNSQPSRKNPFDDDFFA